MAMTKEARAEDARRVAADFRRLEDEWAREDAAREDPHDHHHDDGEVSAEDLRGQLTTEKDLLAFITAGNAVMTFVSKTTGKRLTFRFSRPKDDEAQSQGRGGRPKPIFAAVLAGPQNDADYSFLGTIWPEAAFWTYKISAKSRVSSAAESQRFVFWLVKSLNLRPANVFEHSEVWHEGRCGRCGRRLTVPSSVASGFGPECAGKL